MQISTERRRDAGDTPVDLTAERPRTVDRLTRAPLLTWLSFAVTSGLVVFTAFAILGLALAFVGWFRPLPVALATAAGTVALWRASGISWRGQPALRGSWATIAAVAVALTVAGVQIHYSAEHLLIDRDPGIYATTAEHIANSGSITLEERSTPFTSDAGLEYDSSGWRTDGAANKLYPQFMHLLPVLMAPGVWVGGTDGAFAVPGLLAAAALLVFFVFASRLIRPWFALLAMAALASNAVFIYFSRDAYSEIPTIIALFGGFLVLWDSRSTLDARRVFLAGALFGVAALARADALVFLTPLSVYIVLEIWRARTADLGPVEWRKRVRYVVALGGGAALVSTLALADLYFRSPFYYHLLRGEIFAMLVAPVVVLVVGLALVHLGPRVTRLRALSSRWRETIAVAAGIGIVLTAVFFWAGRAALGEVHLATPSTYIRTIEQREGIAVTGTTTFYELALQRIGWFVGIPTIVAGVVGLVVAVTSSIRRSTTRLAPFLLFFASTTLLYLWNPRIFPDLIWMLRRFLPLSIPGMILLAALSLDWIAPRVFSGFGPRGWARATAAAVVCLAMIAVPLTATADVASFRNQRGMASFTSATCHDVGSHGAAVVTPEPLLRLLVPALREVCRAHVAVLPANATAAEIDQLAREWRKAGASLTVVSLSKPRIEELLPGATVHEHVGRPEALEVTLSHRPRKIGHGTIDLYVATA